MKNIKYLSIPYWFDKKLDLYLSWRFNCDTKQKELVLSVWKVRRLRDCKGYEDEWGSNWWRHWVIWKSR